MDKANEYEPFVEALAKMPEPANLEDIYQKTANRFVRERICDTGNTKVIRTLITQLPRYAAVLLFIAGIIGLIMVFNPGNGTGPVALAEVLEPFMQARTLTFDLILQHSQSSDQTIRYSYRRPGHLRQELADGTVTIVEYGSDFKQVLILDAENKTANLRITETSTEEKQMLQVDDIMAKVQAVIQFEETSVERLVESEIEGRAVWGYRTRIQRDDSLIAWQGKGIFTVWADAESALPVRLELFDQMTEITPVLEHITINPDLSADLFSLEAPAGFTVQEASEPQDDTLAEEPDLQVDLDQALVQGFRSWSVLSEGTFPSELSMNAITDLDPNATFGFRQEGRGFHVYVNSAKFNRYLNRYYVTDVTLTEQEERDKALLTQRLQNASKLYMKVFSLSVPWHYAGKGVRVGQANTPIFWYQPADAETCRVIYADLSVADVNPAELPHP